MAPTWEEMDACIEAANGWHKKLATILRCTGLRVNQAMHLWWEDLDQTKCVLRIRPELGKTDEERIGRFVPVPGFLVSEVSTWDRVDEFIIPCNRKAGPRQREARSRDMNRAWERSGVRREVWAGEHHHHGRPHHAFRKGYVSGLKALNADSDAVEHLVGHKLPGLRSTYTDASSLPLQDTVNLIPLVGGSSNTPKNVIPLRLVANNSR